MHRHVWALAWPVMLSNISVPLLGLVDTAILGHLSETHFLAAVAMGSSLLVLVMWSFSFLRMGTTAQIAQSFEQPNRIKMIMTTALGLAMAIGLLIIALSPWLIPFMLSLVDGDNDVEQFATQYLQIRFWFAPVTLLNYAMLGYFIGLGQTRIQLKLLISANLVNGLLNYVFVYHLHFNSAGVAWGTNLAELLQLGLALHWYPHRVLRTYSWRSLKPILTHFFKLNIDLFLRTFLLLFAFAYFMAKGAEHSATLLSANAILINLLMFMSNALDGFAIASESLVGKALAKKDLFKLRQIVRICGQWSLITAAAMTLILIPLHPWVFQLLTSQDNVLALLSDLSWWLILLPLAGFASYWLDGIYIGLSNAKEMRNSLVVAVCVVFLPLTALLSHWPIHGLWVAMYGFLISRALWQGLRLPAALRKIQ